MINREISEEKNYEDWLEFPIILDRHTFITYNLPEMPSNESDGKIYTVTLIEFFKGREVIRSIFRGNWKKGYEIGFDTEDFPIKSNIQYCLRTIIYIKNNRRVFDNIFIKIR
ncbi:hypothetical protein LCGC14_0821750 [marine sediment metagenome]|uniref:Uncharacterized protein n=1 Tax=marine sediment metagenome TaxID=412755 RepID=A0A0F9Q3W1_9ZZZZ